MEQSAVGMEMDLAGSNIVTEAAALRGARRFQEAMDLVDTNIHTVHEDIRVVALQQAFLAASEAGNTARAREYAREIARTDPGLPSIQDFL